MGRDLKAPPEGGAFSLASETTGNAGGGIP